MNDIYNNASWVITKTRLHFGILPFWNKKLFLSAYCIKRDSVRVDVEVKAEDTGGRIVFAGIAENCAIDLDSRKIRRINTVNFPQDDAFVYESGTKASFKILEGAK